MLRLRIDESRCVRCGNCEVHLPDLLKKSIGGVLLVSQKNNLQHRANIEAAVKSCHLDAIMIEEEETESGGEKHDR